MKQKIGLALVPLAVAAVCASAAAAASSPAVSTEPATQVKDSSALLNGKVNPNGSATKYWFVWGVTRSYGSTSATHSVGSGRAAVAVRLSVGRLLPGTRYYFRLYAQNRYGISAGAGYAFTTTGHPLPGAVTGPASDVGTAAATLTGTVVPNHEATRWVFQYGLSPDSYATAPGGGTVAAGATPVPVSERISGLQAGTTFVYRLVAVHSGYPASYGLQGTFTTLPTVRPYARVHASTRPRRTYRKPFMFTTSGTIVPSPSFPRSVQCSGTVVVRYYLGRRRLASALAQVQSDCSFTELTAFTHTFARPHQKRPSVERLRVEVKFRGNGYLGPAQARAEHIVLG